ncbi:Druantia anti-phage system protein DruA [Desulfosarcina ovata]|uniref:Uncharacterized protein n=2 Tax=Desulfosarcina ovata TaxID=83564 RepID=A0A5K8AB29_9BACT|nr:Druantia anti-phage system protein DruA [Desulfosarcina ovata]BBO84024.1 hypothetical protein DSCO28_45900 [Desulfosarcina ovata subsp. sediminis]BBO88973.1 hypothetical protein DSCOOX_21530 [Desulfosarcina ovata subsp. ovata]BBO89815.1 hypothetical protein DSCOOX_29950 [Desulfosarcina ovata subsp. ovata]BBO90278.1 hypothetical protein DSCOOX_34580 [Desulfosarcina ovata subsp. ovata]BBO90498.1 hypothetical protein DSCOOX_36780 [Desulfosarcina ovata subsp. ovata]
MIVQCGRQIESEELAQIRETVETFWRLSQWELAQTVCEHLGWHTASGGNKVDACLKLLKRLEAQGRIRLPAKRDSGRKSGKQPIASHRIQPQEPVVGKLSDIGPIRLRVVQGKADKALFNEYLSRYHYLGDKKPFGCYLRYFVEGAGTLLGCMLFSGAAKALIKRDQWIGWSTNERLRNLGFVVNNGRYLIFPWVKVRYLASCALGKAIRELGRHWQERWGYRPVLLETFVDPHYFDGTCYRAANFRYLGMTRGMGLIRQGQSYATSPKKIFVYPLADNFRQVLCSGEG